MKFVLDASVALAWFIDNPTPPFAARVRRLLENEAEALVPALWHLELANGFVVAERRGTLSSEDIALAVGKISKLLGQSIKSINDLVTIPQALATARSVQLTGYDAVYLDLARWQQLPLATLDRRLGAAASRAGVPLLH